MRHRDYYFRLHDGPFITDEVARELRRLANATPLISIEGTADVSDVRRGRTRVLEHTLAGLDACTRNKLIVGVATSVCRSNIDELVDEAWLRHLIARGVHYVWYHTIAGRRERVRGSRAHPAQVLRVRRFVVEMRAKSRWRWSTLLDDKDSACPMATGISHHINPWGDIEPCPSPFATESIDDERVLVDVLNNSPFIRDFRETAAKTTRGCIVLERPDLVRDLVTRHAARDTTHRTEGAGLIELNRMDSRTSQHQPGSEIPEGHWMYRFAKRHWFFGFGAYTYNLQDRAWNHRPEFRYQGVAGTGPLSAADDHPQTLAEREAVKALARAVRSPKCGRCRRSPRTSCAATPTPCSHVEASPPNIANTPPS